MGVELLALGRDPFHRTPARGARNHHLATTELVGSEKPAKHEALQCRRSVEHLRPVASILEQLEVVLASGAFVEDESGLRGVAVLLRGNQKEGSLAVPSQGIEGRHALVVEARRQCDDDAAQGAAFR